MRNGTASRGVRYTHHNAQDRMGDLNYSAYCVYSVERTKKSCPRRALSRDSESPTGGSGQGHYTKAEAQRASERRLCGCPAAASSGHPSALTHASSSSSRGGSSAISAQRAAGRSACLQPGARKASSYRGEAPSAVKARGEQSAVATARRAALSPFRFPLCLCALLTSLTSEREFPVALSHVSCRQSLGRGEKILE